MLGIIPARYASVRFPGKPLAKLGSRPMIQWVYERASTYFRHLAVATDDERIFRTVREFGGRAVMTDPGHGSGTERCAEAYRILRKEEQVDYTHVVNIQGDEPLLETEQFDALISGFRNPDVSVATLIRPLMDPDEAANPNVVKVVVDRRFRALYFSRSPIPFFRKIPSSREIPTSGEAPLSREIPSSTENPSFAEPEQGGTAPAVFFAHVGLYGFRAGQLEELVHLPPAPLEKAESLEQLRWLEHGYTIQTSVTDFPSHGVDTPEDLERIAHLFK